MERARAGVLDVPSEGENGREFTGEATGIRWKEREGETERDYGGMELQSVWEMRWRDYATRCRTEVRGGTEQTTLFTSPCTARKEGRKEGSF